MKIKMTTKATNPLGLGTPAKLSLPKPAASERRSLRELNQESDRARCHDAIVGVRPRPR